MLEHWPLSETKLQVAPGMARAWADWIETEHGIGIRGTGDEAGIIVLYHPQDDKPQVKKQLSRTPVRPVAVTEATLRHLKEVWRRRQAAGAK